MYVLDTDIVTAYLHQRDTQTSLVRRMAAAESDVWISVITVEQFAAGALKQINSNPNALDTKRMTTVLPDAWTFDLSGSQEREKALTDNLIAFNKSRSNLWDQNYDGRFTAAPLHVFTLDEAKRVVGGLIGRTHSLRAWLEVSILWVDEDYRGIGLGRALMERGEAEAIHRGCLYARLSTSHYQAPGFYEKMGYVLYGKLENCPPGDTSYYYRKDLDQQKNNSVVPLE